MNPSDLSVAQTVRTQALAFKASLHAVDGQLQLLAEDLTLGDAVVFTAHCETLSRLLAECSRLHQTLPPVLLKHPSLTSQLRRLNAKLVAQREGMARRASLVERELKVLFPTREASTYARPVGSYGQSAGLGALHR